MPKKPKPEIIILEPVPDWLVTFGDMMSLLLTFFILLFSVSEVREESKIYDLVITFRGKLPQKKPVYGYLIPRLQMQHDGLMQEVESKTHELGEAGVSSKAVADSEGQHTHLHSIQDSLYLSLRGEVHFNEGDAFLLERGRQALKELLQDGLGEGRFKIVVLGHAASGEVVGEEAEYLLGFQRAVEIRSYLIQNRIPESGIEVQSAGARLPLLASTGASIGRGMNRRVQLLVSPRFVGPSPGR